jgi:AraC-like DNA-binding protein
MRHGSADAMTAMARTAVLRRSAEELIQLKACDPAFRFALLARELRVSPAHLSRVLRASNGARFRDRVVAIRLRAAKGQIERSRLSMKEIAAQVGFRHAADLSRHFRRVFGTPPTLFRLNRAAGDPAR